MSIARFLLQKLMNVSHIYCTDDLQRVTDLAECALRLSSYK